MYVSLGLLHHDHRKQRLHVCICMLLFLASWNVKLISHKQHFYSISKTKRYLEVHFDTTWKSFSKRSLDALCSVTSDTNTTEKLCVALRDIHHYISGQPIAVT